MSEIGSQGSVYRQLAVSGVRLRQSFDGPWEEMR